MTELPDYWTPEDIAAHFGLSARQVRADARRLGCCRLVGNRMFLVAEDLKDLLMAWQPSASGGKEKSNPRVGDYETLRALRHLEKLAKPNRRLKR